MSNTSMELVKILRDRTQVGMMDCKKALEEANGDIEQAVEILRKKGAAVAAKRADNATNHGRIESYVTADGKTGVLIQSACETDFSANTDAMRDFLHTVAEHIATANPASIDALLSESLTTNKGLTVRQYMDELVAKICENIKINNFVRFHIANHGLVGVYIHPGSTVGVMVELEADKDTAMHLETLKQLAKDICMQIAVTNPLCTEPKFLDATVLERERALAQDQLKDSTKPANVIEKIIEGKLGKFYQDVCLLQQPFIKEDKLTVQQHVENTGKKLGLVITVKQFKRFAIGR